MWGIQNGALALLAGSGCAHAIDGPHGPRAGDVVSLDQGWGDEERRIFYRASQGTRLLPLSWFLALEREDSAARFVVSDYVTRYGFIEDPGSKRDQERLPVGFARDVDAATGEVYVSRAGRAIPARSPTAGRRSGSTAARRTSTSSPSPMLSSARSTAP